MEKGDLVRCIKDDAVGITISTSGLEVEVLFGDGMRGIEQSANLNVIPFKPRVAIPANFTEMVDAYLILRGFN